MDPRPLTRGADTPGRSDSRRHPSTARCRSGSALGPYSAKQMKLATTASGRHTADTVHGGHEKVMRQTVIGMAAGAHLAEHENPGEATMLVLHRRVRLSAADLSWEAARGDLLIVPDNRHSLEALEDSAVLLTVAKLP